MRVKAVFLLAGGGLLLLSMLNHFDALNGSSRSRAQSTGYPNPIFNEQEALSVSQDRLALSSSESVVRLISVESLSEWFGFDAEQSTWSPSAPVWLVGLRGGGLTLDDVLPPPPFITSEPPSSGSGGTPPGEQSVDGVFYAWDANGGLIITEGALFLEDPSTQDFTPTFESIVSLPNETLTISTATEAP